MTKEERIRYTLQSLVINQKAIDDALEELHLQNWLERIETLYTRKKGWQPMIAELERIEEEIDKQAYAIDIYLYIESQASKKLLVNIESLKIELRKLPYDIFGYAEESFFELLVKTAIKAEIKYNDILKLKSKPLLLQDYEFDRDTILLKAIAEEYGIHLLKDHLNLRLIAQDFESPLSVIMDAAKVSLKLVEQYNTF